MTSRFSFDIAIGAIAKMATTCKWLFDKKHLQSGRNPANYLILELVACVFVL